MSLIQYILNLIISLIQKIKILLINLYHYLYHYILSFLDDLVWFLEESFVYLLNIVRQLIIDFKYVVIFQIDKLKIQPEIIKILILGFSIFFFEVSLQYLEVSDTSTLEFERQLAAIAIFIRIFCIFQMIERNFFIIVFIFFCLYISLQSIGGEMPSQYTVEDQLFGYDTALREYGFLFFVFWDCFIAYLLLQFFDFISGDDAYREHLLRGRLASVFYHEPYQVRFIFAGFVFQISFGLGQ